MFLGEATIKECLKLDLKINFLTGKIRGLEMRVLGVLMVKCEL